MARKNVNTTIDEDLYKEIRILALQKGVNASEIIQRYIQNQKLV